MGPTQNAEYFLDMAIDHFYRATQGGEVTQIATGLQQMAAAMQSISVGLRATYQKLEAVETLLNRPSPGSPIR